MSYDNTNSGMLAKNDRKEKETHPDYKGHITVGGVEYWLSAWINEGKPGGKMEGRKYLGLSATPKDQTTVAVNLKEAQKLTNKGFDDLDDDLPKW